MKIPATQLAQTKELADFEKEKETLKADLTDCKAKLLKLEEKERRWGADIQLLKKSEAELKSILAIKERELQGRDAKSAI